MYKYHINNSIIHIYRELIKIKVLFFSEFVCVIAYPMLLIRIDAFINAANFIES